jgi:hypothetical protein
MTELKLHPACAVWPPMSQDELIELGLDIEKNGQIETIVTMPDDSILDGRNRWIACELNGIAPRTRLFGSDPTDGDDPIRFALRKNNMRRHMSFAEKCFAADALANMAHGTNQYANKVDASKEASTSVSQDEAATALGVSRAGVQDARVIREDGTPEEVAEVKAGTKSLRATATKLRAKRTAHRPPKPASPQKEKAATPTPPPPPPLSDAEREARLLNRPRFRDIGDAATGRPVGAAASEQDPDSAPGITRMQAYIRKHGRVQPFAMDEVERQKLYKKISKINSMFRRLFKDIGLPDDLPTVEALASLDNRRRNLILQEWRRYFLPHSDALIAFFAYTINHPDVASMDETTKTNGASGKDFEMPKHP